MVIPKMRMLSILSFVAALIAARAAAAYDYDPGQYRPLSDPRHYQQAPTPGRDQYGYQNAPQYGNSAQPPYGMAPQGQYGYTDQDPYGQMMAQPQYGYPGQPPYGQPVQPQYGYPGQPQYGQQPGWTPYGAQDGGSVRLEASISANKAYVYQNLVLTLTVITDTNPSTLDFTLPQSDAFVFKPVGTRTATLRDSNGSHEIVTRDQVLVIPLLQGNFDLNKLTATVKTSSGRKVTVKLSQPLQLDIMPPEPGVQPWLPLENLTLNATLSNEDNLRQGKPASLVLEMSAVGFSGGELPTFENQLKSAGLRVYREKTESEGELKADGKLYGKRTEYYTLLPGQEQQLTLPSIKVQWWNLGKSQVESTLLPMRLLGTNHHRTASPDGAGEATAPAVPVWFLWLPLITIAFVAGLYWSLIWARGKRFGERYARHIRMVTEPIRRTADFWLHRLSPRRHMHRLRRFIAQSLPRSWRLWYCVRVADNESDPEVWLQVLRFLAERRLGIPAQIPLDQLARHIVEIHPRSKPERMHGLLQRLDAAIFGNSPITDFGTWKRLFKREIRPRLLPAFLFRQPSAPARHTGLPALNP